MKYIFNGLLLYFFGVFPIQLSSIIGIGLISFIIHVTCLISSFFFRKINKRWIGSHPEYAIMMISLANFVGIVANFVGG